MHPERTPQGTQRGLALVIVLWLLSALVLLTLGYSSTIRTDTRLAAYELQSLQARALSGAGIHHAIARLLQPPGSRPAVLAQYRFRLEGHDVQVQIRHEAARIDLNTAYPVLLDGLLQGAGVQHWERLRDVILDWKDADQLRRNHGAEAPQYRAAGLAHATRDGPFNHTDELLQVLGMDVALYQRLKDRITVHSLVAGVLPAAASREVLLALPGATPDAVDVFLAARAEGQLPSAAAPAGVDRRYLEFSSAPRYRIRCEARVGDSHAAAEAIVELLPGADPPYQVHNRARVPIATVAEPARTDGGNI